MFIGHYGPSFAIKAIRPAIPLWLLFIAVQLVDVAWAVLVLLGIEKVRIVPGITASNPLDFYYMPYTHGLAASVLWAVATIVLCKSLPGVRMWSAAAWVGIAVFSHWVLDWLVHRPDLPLYDDTMKVGLGIWNYPAIALFLEAPSIRRNDHVPETDEGYQCPWPLRPAHLRASDARNSVLHLLWPATDFSGRRRDNRAGLLCRLCRGCSVARPATCACGRLTRLYGQRGRANVTSCTPLVAGYLRSLGPKHPHSRMLQTHGLTHISLAVRDLERTLRFYVQVFGVREYYRDAKSIQVQGPGPHDVIAFESDPSNAGVPGGITHFGFRLQNANDIGPAIAEVERAGGTVLRRGEFSPGYPYAYVADPDGYEIEIWYE